ncbi:MULTISPECIES: DUF2730 family protein [Ascidiaceihabitans]|uniref:DUF2730 domain-containing protein n=1 Tax=Ascidiaceihabitans donghaensis TaxID=1510460 RepID=A0A2R8BDA8_9RHOB|nr:DUF2730 family protein [Ascidiaceihabitans donghaensis]SPH21002.1 hypothetical protein ASD8599_01743 [Ascidiaceihabitans donghaensis]
MMGWDADTWTKVFSLALSVGAMVFAWFATRSKHVDGQFKAGSKRMTEIETRVSAVEQQMNAMPSQQDFHRLELTLSEIGGDIKAMRAERGATNEAIARIERVVSRHEDHLLDGSKS